MRLILQVILTVLCIATQALSNDERIVFENPEVIYYELEGYKECKFEKLQLEELIKDQDYQIELLKSGIDICNSYNEKLNISIQKLNNSINNPNTITVTVDKPTINKKHIAISLLVGFLLGTSLNLAY